MLLIVIPFKCSIQHTVEGEGDSFEAGMWNSDKSVTDNTASRNVLGLKYIDADQTIKDTGGSVATGGKEGREGRFFFVI
jgi:hypothetical protein